MAEDCKKYYFMADAHLGSMLKENQREHEQKVVRWLDMAAKDADEIFLLGDIFDFWFEYRYVVPKGFTRLLGTLSRMVDNGIKIHFFPGNHDWWTFGYLEKEVGLIVHREPTLLTLNGQTFFLAHGDGLGDNSRSFRFARWCFHNPVLQWIVRTLPCTWGQWVGLKWSASSRQQHEANGAATFKGEDKEHLVQFAKQYSAQNPVDFFVFGHRHLYLYLQLATKSRICILGDFFKDFTYAVLDENGFMPETFECE
ncbi:MAG: UDP-2,3-diacylglucosamine diphosphatase [Bacteroidales bacterium]|nr:UDP-2,3-diacylglucosamine diphosphatase [Bacteroidales bacterium]